MEKSFSLKKKKNVPTTQKEVFKDLGLDNHPLGRDSPESGSLYSDYESGQQYEDKVGYLSLQNFKIFYFDYCKNISLSKQKLNYVSVC